MESDREPFVVDTDQKAEWAIRKIKDIRTERDRLVKVCKEQISFYQDQIATAESRAVGDEGYFIDQLASYFRTVAHHVTKTQEKYTLPSGSLVLRQKPDIYERDDARLFANLCGLGIDDEFVKSEPKILWAELKERVMVVDGKANLLMQDGELIEIDGIVVKPGEQVFEVKA